MVFIVCSIAWMENLCKRGGWERVDWGSKIITKTDVLKDLLGDPSRLKTPHGGGVFVSDTPHHIYWNIRFCFCSEAPSPILSGRCHLLHIAVL